MNIPAHFPEFWKDYELLDCGDFQKLERFGEWVLIRPEPQAIWSARWSKEEWEKLAHGRFEQTSSSAGNWQVLKKHFPTTGTSAIKAKRLIFDFAWP